MGKVLSVIILGGTGIIGRELSRILTTEGHVVYVVSRGNRQPVDGNISILADVYNAEDLQQKTKGLSFDVVVDLVSFNPTQLANTLHVFNRRCEQYMFVSSATVYSSVDNAAITENTPFITEGWSYPLAKIACEQSLKTIAKQTGQIYTIVRPYITYSEQRLSFGIWEMTDVWQRLQQGYPVVIGNEVANTRTTLTHAADLARGMAGLMNNKKAYDEDFHITADESMTWQNVYVSGSQYTEHTPQIVC